MTTKKEVEVTERKDVSGEGLMSFWLCKKKNGRKITCVFDLIELETIRIVLEELGKEENA